MITSQELRHCMRELLKGKDGPFNFSMSVEEGKEYFRFDITIDEYCELLTQQINYYKNGKVQIEE